MQPTFSGKLLARLRLTKSIDFSGQLRPAIVEPVGRIFSKLSAIQTRYGENVENAEGLSHPRKKGSEEMPQTENAQNAETAGTKRKMWPTGFIVIGFR